MNKQIHASGLFRLFVATEIEFGLFKRSNTNQFREVEASWNNKQ